MTERGGLSGILVTLWIQRTTQKTTPRSESSSFFDFFSPTRYGHWSLANSKEEIIVVSHDFDIGLTIKHKIIPYAVNLVGVDVVVEDLREIQKQYDELEAKYLEEREALEAKHQKLYELLYTKRYEIVNGVVEVEGAVPEEEGKDDKGVPNFWLLVLKTFLAMNSNYYSDYKINKRDEGALKYLKDIKWDRIGSFWWTIEFYFDEKNPYFNNTLLTKSYHIIDTDVERFVTKVIGTDIEWYPGYCLTTKPTRTEEEEEEEEDFVSFFDFFSPQPNFDKWFERDVELEFRYEIIPRAVSFFLDDFLDYMYSSSSDSEEYEGQDYDEDDDY